MSLTPPSIGPITVAILAALETGTGRPIGDVAAPPAADVPYGFLTRTGLRWTGSLKNPHEQARLTYQVQCVALTSDDVEWLDWKVREVLAAPPTVTGWQFVKYVAPLGSPGVRLDPDTTPQLFYTTPQFRLIARPTPS